jgi:hypothetical protein
VHFDLPRLATHLAILDILLVGATSGVQRNAADLATIGTAHLSRHFGGAVAQRELGIQIVVQHLPMIHDSAR